MVDTCGTGGDRSGTINVSTIAALVVAGAGVPVCKHGGRAASSKAGSADVLEALGVVIDLGPAGVLRCIEEAGIGFCFAPRYHPAMRHAIPIRRELGVPTAFNFLGSARQPGPGSPAGRRASATRPWRPRWPGCWRPAGPTHVLVVHGADGLDELSTTGPSTIYEWRAPDVAGGVPAGERGRPGGRIARAGGGTAHRGDHGRPDRPGLASRPAGGSARG